jgi:light-regulated signal transduction histidine kinase (bacteriophytochrome)
MNLRDKLYKRKQFYEKVYPGYFNIISLWAGIITLVSFYFIHREMGIRSRYQSELEKKVQELNRSNSELEQFAYIASHDLQEPMRKIRTFTDKLKFKFRETLPPDLKLVVDRIEAAAQRMQELIHDMINFTGLITGEETNVAVDLNLVLERVLHNFSDIANSRKALIAWDTLPTVQGDERQIKLLFRSLLDNAFKFSKPNQAPNIKIGYELVNGDKEEEDALKGKIYHKIIIEDKGIGFSNEFSEKIFMIFQRLHTQQSGYIGKGVGLAIVHRIMSNHNGMIIARGLVDGGATFFLYFPAPEAAGNKKNPT